MNIWKFKIRLFKEVKFVSKYVSATNLKLKHFADMEISVNIKSSTTAFKNEG